MNKEEKIFLVELIDKASKLKEVDKSFLLGVAHGLVAKADIKKEVDDK